MDSSADTINTHFQYNNIQKLLQIQLEKLQHDSVDLSSNVIYALSALNDSSDYQLEQELEQERQEHTGKRILLIPYFLQNSHWIGILIEIQSSEEILRAEYLDPLNESAEVPRSLQKQFTKVYPSSVLQSRVLEKNNDPRLSANLTVKNLLTAVKNNQNSNAVDEVNQYSYNISPTAHQTNSYSIESESQSLSKNEDIQNEGNEYKLDELEQELNKGLRELKMRDADMLLEKIRKTEKRISEYEEEERTEDVQKEKEYLERLQRLQNIGHEIDRLKTNISCSKTDHQSDISKMKEELMSGLAKLKIRDATVLSEKIKKTKERIKEYEEEERIEDANKENIYLKELEQLQNLSEKIAGQTNNSSMEIDNRQVELNRLKQELNNGLTKLKIREEKLLSDKIQKTKGRIQDYEEEERTEDAEKEKTYLKELEGLQNLSDQITQLTYELSRLDVDNQSEILRMKEELNKGLGKFKIPNAAVLPNKIQKTKERIKDFEEDDRIEDVQKERGYLYELEKLQKVSDEINRKESSEQKPELTTVASHDAANQPFVEQQLSEASTNSGIVNQDKQNNKLIYLENMSNDAAVMPPCAIKTILELLIHYEKRLLQISLSGKDQRLTMSIPSEDEVSVTSLLKKLTMQLRKEELFSESRQTIVQDIQMYTNSDNCSNIIPCLNKLLKEIRVLDVLEIQRLTVKAAKTAELIRNKEVILFVASTGVGKSTTIQFLAGAQMEELPVEVAPGKFLRHITAVGPITNPELKDVKSNPTAKSETRYIAPVSMHLKDIFGAQETGVLILCDAPGFDDQAGPEVDIANGIGVIEALKGTKSVKILALSSYKGLGDKGQGIQELEHMLVNMIHNIEDKLDSIFYAFTKFPDNVDINALLLDIKTTKVDNDPLLQHDTGFVTVLKDMIEKTEDGVFKIDPVRGDRKKLIRQLKRMRGIQYPEDVFHFSMSEKTRAKLATHLQNQRYNISCAMTSKDIDLVLYYLNDLKILNNLIKDSTVRHTYEDAIRFTDESINKYCREIMKKFNRALVSQDGLEEQDIVDYETLIEYLEQIQILKEHLGSSLLSPTTFTENIISQLNERNRYLNEQDLHSPLVTIYLDNLSMLKNSFKDFESNYQKSCKELKKRFEELIESVRELIRKNDFKQLAEILLNIQKSSQILKDHLGEKIEEKYHDVVRDLFEYLNSFSKDVEPLLAKVRLNNEDIETLKKSAETLRSAKDNAALQERVSIYLDVIQTKEEVFEENNSNDCVRDLNKIYEDFITKLINYFDQIGQRIVGYLDRNESQDLVYVQNLINDMNIFRTIPEVEAKTAATYYRIIENVRSYMQQIQREAQQLLDQQSGNINYRQLGRVLARLKSAEWINQVSPGTYENLMRRITEDLVEYAEQLEESFTKIDLSLKYPENIPNANGIIEKIESIRDLERSIPELGKYRTNISEGFLVRTQAVFDRIQKIFNLQDKDIYQIKQEVKMLEEIKREYENLHPARIYLQQQGYSSINMLENEIEELNAKVKIANERLQIEEHEAQSKLDDLHSIVRKYVDLDSSSSKQDKREYSKITTNTLGFRQNTSAEKYLESIGYSSIDEVSNEITTIKKMSQNKLKQIQEQILELNLTLQSLRSKRTDYEMLLNTRNGVSSTEIEFLRSKGFDSVELIDETIKEKIRIIHERGTNKQTYYFSHKLDASTANNALMYTKECEKVSYNRVKENAIDANQNLQKYIQEYGIFLKQEIQIKFNCIRDTSAINDPFRYSQDLELCLQELFSFKKFPHLYLCINGAESIECWEQEFYSYLRNLSTRMDEYKAFGKNKELKDHILIAKGLSGVDHFFKERFANNGFDVLYRQNQVELTKGSKQAYKNVVEYILAGDYANASIALSDIEDHPLNPKDVIQIKHDLTSSLNKLMRDTRSIVNWLDGKIEREDNRNEIDKIKKNIDDIRTACNKQNIVEFLDDNTQPKLKEFDNDINEILAEIILKGLKSVAAYMSADSFSAAEKGMETLSRIQRELAGYCTSPKVTEKSEELREKLDGIVEEILGRDDFRDVSKYSVNPPKDLLARLQIVAEHGSARFTQAYTSMLGRIRATVNLAIENVRKAPLNERSGKIHSLQYALHFLPDDLREEFKLHIEQLGKLITEEQADERQRLDKLFVIVDEDEHAITQIGVLAEQYSKERMHELFRTLCDQCLTKVYMYRTNIQKSLDEQNISSALVILKKLFKLEASVGGYIPEIRNICESIRLLIKTTFSNCCDTLGNISSIEQTSLVEKAFNDIIIYLNFSNTSDKQIEEFFTDDVMQRVRENFDRMSYYLKENSGKFRIALKDMDIIELHRAVAIAQKWQKFVEKLCQCSLNHNLVRNLLKEIREVISYEHMITEVEQVVYQLKEQLNVQFITDETTRFEDKREKLFSHIMNVYNVLKNLNHKLRTILTTPIDIDTYEKEIKGKIDKIKNQLLAKASKEELTTRDADDFRMYYNHLLACEKYVRLPGLDVRQILIESEEKIHVKVNVLVRQLTSSMSNVLVVSTTLVKIKFFAENLPMFRKTINDEIDNVLKGYKKSQGDAGIQRLSIELEKTDVGARLISEHSSLSGEDWRTRRAKMQKQDDLEYMLQNLTGDSLSKEILRSRYKVFRHKYNELLSTFLNGLISTNNDKEPDLEVLVTQTKLLVGTVTQTADSITWPRAFRDTIPELLAHIFAIWTLKNTQHYNAMRGINEAQAYLLMPHVGQVIAIFRLLGLGYEKFERKMFIVTRRIIADDLVNNLAEVGTGEGKSVVLAITACVFALTGADVNCSCYSEVLSTRDKNDFTSVFRTLGIENRIEYGTFNKLCENLLNEQCNVRDKVREMILTNQSTINKSDTTTRIRPKILLIDEVDVFLSDKYYGGMYTPAVYLKESAIKALLDAIWQNKTFRTLNSVKALPAYQTCATKFRNWIFLFDEAIKDMIAALQSYQSSTYIVQNDKIVYVHGESIVENIVRGYDTVWTYYHEKDKGKISQSSLDENVGILINCGQFSYAEMPHDFSYIGGVTGTLKTLAKIEKRILEDVYAINKTTYIPSVFGSSNRTYNHATDVRVVEESEYFMEIFGEIRSMSNADRAILVFFESEEKLMAFYNAPELAGIKQDVQIITEKVSVEERELFIKRAATIRKTTLLTRTFGRGTDFVCRNQQLLANGGIHVLQTFFSEELSEEYQIMGRGARQGDRGSYRMILLDKDLEWVLGSSYKEELKKKKGYHLYEALNEARTLRYESKCGAKKLAIAQCKTDHEASRVFLTALISGNLAAVKEFLKKQNQGANLVTANSRTVLLMDATGSMSGLLSATKETVCTMFERASKVLEAKALPNDAFQMQFVVYRDYDCKNEGVLQSSSWETKPNNLRNFMTTVSAMGGGDYEEAIEIGLWHAVQQSEQPEGLSQVILIGDAPAKDRPAITRDRQASGGEAYWSTTKYKTPTHYTEQLEKLKAKAISVHTFYLADGARDNFQRIASATSGRCEKLNINSAQGAEMLTNFVTEVVLRKTAGDQGDAVVQLYRKMYVRHLS